ncbi:MAG: hypothetical protein V3U87_06250 [Methylococcaceae bacterium]
MYLKISKNLTLLSIGVVLSILSIQVSAKNPDNGMPKEMCFHIDPHPNLIDPEGAYIELGFKAERKVKLEDKAIKLVRAHGIAIGRTPILPVGWGEWIGSPISGTCHKHDNKYQCSLHTVSSITTQFPPSPIGWAVTTAHGNLALMHDLTTSETSLSETGAVNVSYFDPAGTPIPDDSAVLSGLSLKTFKKVKNFIYGLDIYEVECDSVPHPETAPFFIP